VGPFYPRGRGFGEVEGLVSVVAKETLPYSILHLLMSNIANCLCKNLVFEFLSEVLLSSLYLSYYRYEDNLIEELLCGLLLRVDFLPDISLYLKIDKEILCNYKP
jgi:hypothetical protein